MAASIRLPEERLRQVEAGEVASDTQVDELWAGWITAR